ncbi:hypothetical protein ASG90_01135 [Nocardioides sp. Soil797]|nr:hypothetical protein ASG90_01135 [Nocardioides sp. Soil797]
MDQIVVESRLSTVDAFVLESRCGGGPDVEFTRAVLEHVAAPSTLRPYDPAKIPDFLGAMSRCTIAVSMKLHSSALWGYMGTQIHPILYAPKTASLFHVPWRGLEILNEPHHPVLTEAGVPTTTEVIQRWLHEETVSGPVGRFSRSAVLSLQSENTFHGVVRKIAARF